MIFHLGRDPASSIPAFMVFLSTGEKRFKPGLALCLGRGVLRTRLGTCLGVWVGMTDGHHCGGEKTRDRFVRTLSSSFGHASIQQASSNCRMRS